MFVDEAWVDLKAGNGGNGCLSFRREKFLPKGGPDGGDGGKGGDVVLVCNPHMDDLTPYKYTPHASAQNGDSGRGAQQTGKSGEDCLVQVPPGTVVWEATAERVVTELLYPGQKIILLRGGRGGKGNENFKSSTNRAPRHTTPGELGELGRYKLVLKTIAEVGLVGFPNAGKSSLMRRLTHATPKVAPYPFTTLIPNVGVVIGSAKKVRMADIPGLIDGASANKGLGHKFLRHIERCTLLLFVLDAAGTDNRNPLDDYRSLQRELKLYDPTLLDKPALIVANKCDLPEAAEHLKKLQKKLKNVHVVSCFDDTGLAELKDAIEAMV